MFSISNLTFDYNDGVLGSTPSLAYAKWRNGSVRKMKTAKPPLDASLD